jgi:cytochrome c553
MSAQQNGPRSMRWLAGFTERRFLMRFGAIALTAGAIGLFVLVSGIMPVKASSGHWEITNWVLSFASRRSVATNSLGISVPRLDDPNLIRLGAAHYESGCQWCHGSPDERRPRVPLAMTPAPPYLPDSVDRWKDRELFYIVKHGIKFTGMPAWPSQVRDEDVWPVVAFLRAFPEIDADQYRQLAGRDPEPLARTEFAAPALFVGSALQQCIACHGIDGNRQMGELVPQLAGQSQAYLEESLRDKSRSYD